jgi:long-chain acyl-CoA synthetase
MPEPSETGAGLADNDIVLVAGVRRVTRRQYRERAARARVLLEALGVGAGDTIGVALRNRPEFFELLAAATALGARSVPIAWRLKHEEVSYLVEDSGAKIVFHDEDSAGQMAGLPAMSITDYERRLDAIATPDDAAFPDGKFAMQLYSSGTTGRPKAIERDFSNVDMKALAPKLQLLNLINFFGLNHPGEVHLICGPLYHSQPIGFGTSALAAGHKVVMMEGGFDAETCLKTIDTEKVTWLTCVPTHLIRMLALPDEVKARYDTSSVKVLMHSAAPCPPEVKQGAMELFPRDSVWEVYGGTEGALTIISAHEARAKPGSVGRAHPPGQELRIMDLEGNVLPPGEVGLIYGQSLLDFRYKDAPELDRQTWRDGFFTLGDMGYLDEDGYLFITDRMKDMIISGGANIYPAEVERVLFQHPAVADAAVIGVPDSQWGESVKAIVEPRRQVSEQEIIAFCRDNMAHYKCPTSVEFVDVFPRDPNGKVRKRELRERYWADVGRAV